MKPGTERVPPAIAVLGMHRSGTSCLAGLLEDAGVYLGPVSKANPHNLKGNQENRAIMRLHDELLAANGASWDRPPRGDCRWSAAQRRQLATILDAYRGREPWAFKDPRSLFALEGWLQAVPGLRLVATFRHPLAVARSLEARGGISADRGLALWDRYNRRLLAVQKAFGFDLVCFDLEPDAYLASVQRAFQRLGLDLSVGRPGFFENTLRRQQAQAVRHLPWSARRLYARLRRRAL